MAEHSEVGHRQVVVQLKSGEAEIDEGIVALVEWLDRFPSVHPMASCQGGGSQSEPFVTFGAGEDDLFRVMKGLGVEPNSGLKLTASISDAMRVPTGPRDIRYCLRFSGDWELKRRLKSLGLFDGEVESPLEKLRELAGKLNNGGVKCPVRL